MSFLPELTPPFFQVTLTNRRLKGTRRIGKADGRGKNIRNLDGSHNREQVHNKGKTRWWWWLDGDDFCTVTSCCALRQNTDMVQQEGARGWLGR